MRFRNFGDGSDSQAAGNTQASAASRSAAFHQAMNPACDPDVLTNYLARMLPLHRTQSQVYKLGQKHPPGFEDGFTPIWECATALLPGQQTTQLRINFQREFHLLALMGSAVVGGVAPGAFRAQIYDTKKQYLPDSRPGVRLAARGVIAANYFGGNASGAPQWFFLREPHPFTEPDAQALVIIQNQNTTLESSEIQVVLYGVARRFNWPD